MTNIVTRISEEEAKNLTAFLEARKSGPKGHTEPSVDKKGMKVSIIYCQTVAVIRLWQSSEEEQASSHLNIGKLNADRDIQFAILVGATNPFQHLLTH